MRVFISADIEGVSGVCHVKQADDLGSDAWRDACGLMRGDVDAALEGCAGAGADEVLISDGHYDGDNLSAAGLPAWAGLVSGAQQDLSMMQGIDASFDVALLVGYHAMAGTEAGVLAHTWNGELAAVTLVEPGGGRREVGEFGMNAAVAGAFGVPAVFVSGDDRLCEEAAAFVPGIEAAVTKVGVSRTAARLFPPEATHQRIRAGVERALRADRRPDPLRWDGCGLELTFGRVEWCDKAAFCPGTERLDGRRLLIKPTDWLRVYRTFVVCATLSEG